MNVNKRLFHYGTLYKRTFIIAIIMLIIAVVADLSGPMIAKNLINNHIVGIEQTWYETPGAVPDAVLFHGHYYKRSSYFTPSEKKGTAVSLVQVDQTFYFVHHAYVSGATSSAVHGIPLTRQQLFDFYQPEVPKMIWLAVIYFALILVSAVFTYGQRFLLQVSANRILQRMRQDVFRQMGRLPIAYFDNLPAGKIVSRITNDTEAIREFYVTVVANLLSSMVNMIGIYIALFILDVQLALMCLLLLPILGVWIVLYRKYAVAVNHHIRLLLSDINATINETLQGIPIIRAFHRQARTLDEFNELNTRYFKGQIRLLMMNSASGWNLVGVMRGIFFVALIAYFGYRALHLEGVIEFGVLYAFVDYLNRLFQPVVQIINQLSGMEQARVAAERVFQLLDEEGVNVASGVMDRYQGNVKFEDVFFTYDGKQDVLKGISFEARQGQTIAMVGHTGSGKSSIMNLLFRFYDPRAGSVTIDGINIGELPRQHVRKHMGIVLQDPFLFTGTIATNVSLEDPSIPRERVDQALREVGADQLLGHLPNSWDEPVLEKGSTLSAGQRQLISFARALAFDPAILVLDEATSSIDTETEAVIQQALEVLKRGRTTFIIAHRLSTIRNADMILVLDHGVIVERGTHEELMAQGGRYFQMYQLQSGSVSA